MVSGSDIRVSYVFRLPMSVGVVMMLIIMQVVMSSVRQSECAV